MRLSEILLKSDINNGNVLKLFNKQFYLKITF
jgi:hypothetical protein